MGSCTPKPLTNTPQIANVSATEEDRSNNRRRSPHSQPTASRKTNIAGSMPITGTSAMKASSEAPEYQTIGGMRGSGGFDAGMIASSTASATMVPRTMRGNSSAPKPRVIPSGICSNQKVAANSASAIAMTTAAAARVECHFNRAERFQGLFAVDHELVELCLPGAGAGHAVHRLAGVLQVGLEHLPLHRLHQAFLEHLDAVRRHALGGDEAAHGRLVAGVHADLLAGRHVRQRLEALAAKITSGRTSPDLSCDSASA